ncbi:hydrolase 1, exosortase A system-associated [Massilia alkalitolerans]|uniref:hydrolase 1, exosortase A system-associated n=1 Tax=Massilia alkalitolerans TaxID=286638 RepID=UPI0004283521|nr:hydrolase 1, exosortase A system-associated [Massilia alkalitolerans]
MGIEERALSFPCGGDWLVGVASLPAEPASRGVLVVVGGSQYRTGSHRQFTLLARALAQDGIPAMRFDYRGMGDSEGETRSFESVDDDLRAAIDAFFAAAPGLREVVLWGLCDGASAAALYARSDRRVAGLVLLNPWVRTDDGLARTTLRHYYRQRLGESSFWRRLLSGRLDLVRSIKSAIGLVRAALAPASPAPALPERMHAALAAFGGRVMVVIGGADLTGREFCDLATTTPAWKKLLSGPRVTRHELDGADHTFSRRAWRDQVAAWTSAWVRSW